MSAIEFEHVNDLVKRTTSFSLCFALWTYCVFFGVSLLHFHTLYIYVLHLNTLQIVACWKWNVILSRLLLTIFGLHMKCAIASYSIFSPRKFMRQLMECCIYTYSNLYVRNNTVYSVIVRKFRNLMLSVHVWSVLVQNFYIDGQRLTTYIQYNFDMINAYNADSVPWSIDIM